MCVVRVVLVCVTRDVPQVACVRMLGVGLGLRVFGVPGRQQGHQI
jgi:hypothetical protein